MVERTEDLEAPATKGEGNNYWDMYFEEKISINEIFEVETENNLHMIDKDNLKESIKNLPFDVRKQIKDQIAYIELRNGDINHFLQYIAEGMIMGGSKDE